MNEQEKLREQIKKICFPDWGMIALCGCPLCEDKAEKRTVAIMSLIEQSTPLPSQDAVSGITKPPKTGAELITVERERQMSKEGWTAEHDDEHSPFSMAIAGACYVLDFKASTVLRSGYDQADYLLNDVLDYLWPFDGEWWKPTPNDPIRQLTKAGALIAAEIDRLQRMAGK